MTKTGKYEVRTEIDIDAPPERVWEVLFDLDRYGEWNRAVPRVSLKGAVETGTKGTIRLRALPGPALPAPIRLTTVKRERELRWEGQLPVPGGGRVFHGNHYHLLEPRGENGTRFVHGEAFSGITLPVLWPLLGGGFEDAYAAANRRLKRLCEKG